MTSSSSISRRVLLVGGLSMGVAALTACGANSDPLDGASGSSGGSGTAGEIVIGSVSTTENVILAHLYSQALVARGQRSSVRASLGPREVCLAALRDGSISGLPELTGDLLRYLDPNTTATTATEVGQALPMAVGPDLRVLKASPAVDQDVYVVSSAFARRYQVTSLADLAKVGGTLTLAGPTELEERDYGPPGLEQIYGVKLKAFRADNSAAVRSQDLSGGRIQLATFRTTESAMADDDFRTLADPQSMILPQAVVPLVRTEVAGDADVVAVLDAVQAALTTADLAALNQQVDRDGQDPAQVAGAWLTSKRLG